MTEYKEHLIYDHTTAQGTQLLIKRTPAGRMRYLIATGPTDPTTHTFPIAAVEPDDFDRILRADMTASLSFISEAINVHEDHAIPAQLAAVSMELNPSDPSSFASKLMAVLARPGSQ